MPEPAAGHVVVGLHGMNDYANAFHMAAPYWASKGVSPSTPMTSAASAARLSRGIWPDEDLMREDLRTAVDLARKTVPSLTRRSRWWEFPWVQPSPCRPSAPSNRQRADQFIASGPGLRGWGAMNLTYRTSLWLSAHVRPGWVVQPPRRFVRIEPSDNVEMLQRTWSDPLMMPSNRIDQVYGLVSLMERAHERAPNLPQSLPTLMSYGANDYVVPAKGACSGPPEVLPSLTSGRSTTSRAIHMLLRDLQAQTVHDDYLAFMLDPEPASCPARLPEWPFR
jgi:acylglycerol lipase